MGEIKPIKLVGNWLDGYAMDYHIKSSIYLGEDQWGHPQFDTQRSDIGELLYELKYRRNQSKAKEILELIAPFLNRWNIGNKIDFIISAPPSTKREVQPVYLISNEIGHHLNKKVFTDILEKNSAIQSKNLVSQKEEIKGTIKRKKRFTRKVNLLIIDDLFQSGRTLTEIVQEMKTDPNVNNIYVLTITKTKR